MNPRRVSRLATTISFDRSGNVPAHRFHLPVQDVDHGVPGPHVAVFQVAPHGVLHHARRRAAVAIVEIDDVPVRGLTLAQIIAKLRGPINSQTRLKISRAQDAPIEVAVTRAPIYIPGVELQVKMDAGTLVAEAAGPLPILNFEKYSWPGSSAMSSPMM